VRTLRAWLLRLAGVRDSGRGREIDAEIESHLQLHIDDNIRAGMTPREARRHAILKLGGIESTREAYRDRATAPLLENLLQDARFAIRQLRKSPGFTAAAVLMLALGMCAAVAIFAFVDGALIKPLPYRNPERLVGVFETVPSCPQCNLSYLDYLDWQRMNNVFSSLAAYQGSGASLSTPSGAERVPVARVSDEFFRTLGVTPVLGRDFREGEDLPSAPHTLLLSYAAWQARFGGKSDVLGQAINLNGDPHTIIGVLPRDFHFAPAVSPDFWISLHATRPCERRRGCHNLYGVGRLKDGVSLEVANAEMQSIAKALEKQYPDSNRDQGAVIVPLAATIVGKIQPVLLVLLGGAGLLLLIAGVNVASLLLVRSEGRKREIAVRQALGASAARVVRQFVTESLVLVAAGSALGITLAWWAMHLLGKLVPDNMMQGMPYLQYLDFNPRTFAFAGAIALAAAALFAVTPSLHLCFADSREGLAEGSRGSAGTAWRRVGSKLVMLELATTVVLLVGAGLLGQSLVRVLSVDVGFRPERLAILRVGAPDSGYPNAEKLVALERRILDRIAVLPGVESVALTGTAPLSGGNTTWIRVAGRPYRGEHNDVQFREVSHTYFETLRTRLLRGRHFTEADDASKPPVIVVNQAFVRQYFPGEDPLGRQLLYAPTTTRPPMEIVGVVDDIKESALDEATRPTLYVAFRQEPTSSFALLVRTAPAAPSIIPGMTAAIHRIDPAISTAFGKSVSDLIRQSPPAYLRRGSAWLVGAFAAVAFLLSMVGLYGVVAYSVSQRTREIGVRIALGAQRGAICRLILKEAGWLTAAGIAIGLAGSLAAATMLDTLLFGVRSWDVATLAAVAALLGLSALLATYIPARRAASLNPIEALHAE
jgi:macrolide transport system ATP-binding/permease protein